jgi:UTP--glucose-1-phosphate uridylyltransferase
VSKDNQLILNPNRQSNALKIDLDKRYYQKIDLFDDRFPAGVPSLVECEALTVIGDVRFESDVIIKGRVTIKNNRKSQAVIKKGTVIDRDLTF